MISESALEDGGIESLAERLGIGGRHLRRLFLQHLGANPVAVAQTRRLHFAKKLIDDSRLPMGEVALASGFGSIRRFNAAFRKTYNRTPTQLRKLRQPLTDLSSDEYRFLLRFRPPLDWDALMSFLSRRATPGVELVEGSRYARIFSLGDGVQSESSSVGWLEATLDESGSAIVLRIRYPQPRCLFLIVERARRIFDLGADPNEIMAHLRSDPWLAERIGKRIGARVPGAWNGFELSVRAILGQQVTVPGATTLAGRLASEFGTAVKTYPGFTHLFPTPKQLANARLERVGLTRARAQTLRSLAQAVVNGQISFSNNDTEEFVVRFCSLPGIGDWTAQYVAMRALNEPDAFPASDLGLLRASGFKNPRELAAKAEAWRPWRAYAAMYLWQSQKSAQKGMNDDNLRYPNQLHSDREPGGAAAYGGGRLRSA